MDDEMMDEFDAADAAMQEITPAVVLRHRAAGVLTWALLHQIEAEVLDEVARSGRHGPDVLNTLRAPAAMEYPCDDSPVSFAGHGLIPLVFSEIKDAWDRVH